MDTKCVPNDLYVNGLSLNTMFRAEALGKLADHEGSVLVNKPKLHKMMHKMMA